MQKQLLLFSFLLIALYSYAQPRIIYYGNDSLLINETFIPGNVDKTFMDELMQSKGKSGIIIRTQDDLITPPREKQRYFGYLLLGLFYRPFVKNPENFTFSIRLEFEPEDLKRINADTGNVYKGLLVLGNQFITKESNIEKILANPAFSLIKKGDDIFNKRRRIYALVSFQDILVKLFYNTQNGRLKLVELIK
jgi:hypothetical protein